MLSNIFYKTIGYLLVFIFFIIFFISPVLISEYVKNNCTDGFLCAVARFITRLF